MNIPDEKVIELHKKKLIFLIFVACMFVAFGCWLMQMNSAEIEAHRRFNSPWFVHGIGLLSILFFGLCGVFGIRKLFDKTPGLIFSVKGIYDNSSGVSAGLIPWTEIQGFSVFEIKKQKMLVIKVITPEKYIEVGNPVKRALNRMNYKMCGSPIAISSNALKVSFEELQDILSRYLTKYGRSA
jgi:hypothetical protein